MTIQKVPITLFAAVESFVVALFFNNFLPTNIGGDLMRIRDTATLAGSSARATTVVVADRILGLIALAVVTTVAAGITASNRLGFSVFWIWTAFGAAIVAGSIVVLVMPEALNRLTALTRMGDTWIGVQIRTLTNTLIAFRTAPAALGTAFGSAILVHLAIIACYVSVTAALRVTVGVWDMALIVPLSALVQAVPLSINGLGLREAAFTVLFGRIGVPRETALAVSLEATALILAFSLIGACAYILRRPSTPDDRTLFESGIASPGVRL
jgi:uncharacterized membrane protein YbhN (UPF0104 family)